MTRAEVIRQIWPQAIVQTLCCAFDPHVQAADAKLVLVGDYRQLPELEAGGAFRTLASTLGAVQLSQNRRQTQAWERAALDELRDGDPTRTLDDYEAAGRIQRADRGADARAALTANWWQASTDAIRERPSPEVVMLAVRRTEVDELNLRGPLPHARRRLPDRAVIARRNDYRHGLINGQRGLVTTPTPTAAR